MIDIQKACSHILQRMKTLNVHAYNIFERMARAFKYAKQEKI